MYAAQRGPLMLPAIATETTVYVTRVRPYLERCPWRHRLHNAVQDGEYSTWLRSQQSCASLEVPNSSCTARCQACGHQPTVITAHLAQPFVFDCYTHPEPWPCPSV